MSRETERVVELAFEVGEKMTHVLREAIPAAAQIHLINAQRELLTALVLIYEHQVGEKRASHDGYDEPVRRPRARKTTRARRVRPIDIE